MKKIILTFFLVFAFASQAHAVIMLDEDTQVIKVNINSDFSATGNWSLPIRSSYRANQIFVPEFHNYGMLNGTKYTLQGVTESGKKIDSYRTDDEYFAFNPTLISQGTIRSFDIKYTIQPAFSSPVAIYEFFFFDEALRQKPSISITYPAGWKVLSQWPEGTTQPDSSLFIPYPARYPDAKPIIVVFQTNPSLVETFGKYTISGTKNDIQKVKSALAKISFTDDLLMNTIGTKTPDNVLIVVDDVTKADEVGYEAEALAGRPNIVLVSNKLLAQRSVNELAETLAHEFMHLAMFNLELFQNRNYYSPWLSEGMAVFFETLAHNKIYTDSTEKILIEELDRTRAVSPKEASVLYESKFDFDFMGDRDLGTSASYNHAGIVFSNFYDKKGKSGFDALFKQLANSNLNSSDPTDTIESSMKNISGLSEGDLLYPGKSNNSVDKIISKIGHPENDPDQSADIVVDYIKNKTKHYFSGSKSAVVSTPTPTPTPSVTTKPTTLPKTTIKPTNKPSTTPSATPTTSKATVTPTIKVPTPTPTPVVTNTSLIQKITSWFK